ncbi:MAG: YezD family protein [Pirellulales bacterium]|nr:YezD family protein [Pirellulales bacterium]
MTEPITNSGRVPAPERGSDADEALAQIRESLRGLKFGSVNIIVQDGVIIQIDRTEKRRLRTNRTTN